MIGWNQLRPEAASLLRAGAVIPAHPLALTAERRLDERRQRALSRYYAAAGAQGIAVGVHTTQFAIRRVGLFDPVLEIAAESFDASAKDRPVIRIAGVVGPTAQAVREAEVARSYGYDAVLVSSAELDDLDEKQLVARSAEIGEVLPVIGFLLQEAIGGRSFSVDYWQALAEQESTVAVKVAPFDRYATVNVLRGVELSGRADDIALYTGNDDTIVSDLLGEWWIPDNSGVLRRRVIAGGLLGHWAVWTRSAVRLMDLVRAARAGDEDARSQAMQQIAGTIDANAAVFDARNRFAGVIAGVHEVLRRQGLLAGTWCLDPTEDLSPGQGAEIARVMHVYPWLREENDFVEAGLDEWMA